MSSREASESSARIVSMDQFRGFTILSMFAVHYSGRLQGLVDLRAVLHHNNTFLSYADVVLPAFLFASGFSLRLALLRRLKTVSPAAAYGRVVRRCLLLILILQVLMLDRWLPRFREVANQHGVLAALDVVAKGRMWDSLSIIGFTSLWVLPVIAAPARARLTYLLGGLAIHAVLCQLFYFDYLFGLPNWLDNWLGVSGELGYEGGVLGVLTWAVPMLAGTFVYDWVSAGDRAKTVRLLLITSTALVTTGYLLSCLSTFYPLAHAPSNHEYELVESHQIASSPVILHFGEQGEEGLRSHLATLPFLRPGPDKQRQLNYWIMSKRVVTPAFVITATGLSMLGYVVFVLLCDVRGWQPGVLRTFGQNPLVAYILELFILNSLLRSSLSVLRRAMPSLLPHDESWQFGLIYCILWFAITYLVVRLLEYQKIYLRL
jgi:predicted acyltransferase